MKSLKALITTSVLNAADSSKIETVVVVKCERK